MKKTFTLYHILTSSFWPFAIIFSLWDLLISVVCWMHYGPWSFCTTSLYIFIFIALVWGVDIHEESEGGNQTSLVLRSFRLGMILFIISEIFFFFSFFWSYFHSSWNPSVSLGGIWPPLGFKDFWFDPLGVPLLNTGLLVISSITLTFAHHSILKNSWWEIYLGVLWTMVLGLFFLLNQFHEYQQSTLSMNSTVYGTVFFVLTGFHGMHVCMGLSWMTMCFIRFWYYDSLSKEHHVLVKGAVWYWHFVDVVWIFLYMSIYWLGQ